MTDVRIVELKARLSEHLRKVRAGRSLTILDHDTPIARIVPWPASESTGEDPAGPSWCSQAAARTSEWVNIAQGVASAMVEVARDRLRLTRRAFVLAASLAASDMDHQTTWT